MRAGTRAGQYPRPEWVREAARLIGVTEGTLHNWVYGPENVFLRCASVVSVMVSHGRAEEADARCELIDRARYPESPAMPLPALEVVEQEADGAEDVAQLVFQQLPEAERPRAWWSRRRAILKSISALQRLLRAGDVRYPRPS